MAVRKAGVPCTRELFQVQVSFTGNPRTWIQSQGPAAAEQLFRLL